MKEGFHLLTAASFAALIGVVACGPQNVPQPQRIMGPGIMNPMANQQMLMNRQMLVNQQMRITPPINTNTNSTTNRTTPPPLPQKPIPVPTPAADTAEIKRNFELTELIESAHLIHLRGSTFRLIVQVAENSTPHDVVISLLKNNGKAASRGLIFELKQVASTVGTRRVFNLSIFTDDKKAKAEVIFQIARAEFGLKDSDILATKKGSDQAKELSKKISELVGKTSVVATMSYSWIQNPKLGITYHDTFVNGVDFTLMDGDDVLIGLTHIQYDALDRVPADNLSQLALKGGKLLEDATGQVMKDRGFKSSKASADEMIIKVSLQEQTLNLGFREATKTLIRHTVPSVK